MPHVTDYDKLTTAVPINRTAATVVSQAGVRNGDDRDPEMQLRNLENEKAQIFAIIKATNDECNDMAGRPNIRKLRREKRIGLRPLHKRLVQIDNEIALLAGGLNRQERQYALDPWIVQVVQERTTKAQFRSIVQEAAKRYRAALLADQKPPSLPDSLLKEWLIECF